MSAFTEAREEARESAHAEASSGAVGTDPASLSPRILLDTQQASTIDTDANGVTDFRDALGSGRDLEQGTNSLKPAVVSEGLQSDANDRLDGKSPLVLGDLIDPDGYTVILSFKTPASISTDSGTRTSNETIISGGNYLTSAFFKSTGPVIGCHHFDTGHREIEVSVALDTWYAYAHRYDTVTGNMSIRLGSAGAFTDLSVADVNALHSTQIFFTLASSAGISFQGIFRYAAIFDSARTDDEVTGMLEFLEDAAP